MIDALNNVLSSAYPWIKSLHVMAVMSWMAGLFYLPRLFVHHTERVAVGSETDSLFLMMEGKLFRLIMSPAMHVTWVCGLLLVLTPGIVFWGDVWPWLKATSVIAMTVFHIWLGKRLKIFVAGGNELSGKQYRILNEVPTLLMIIIVVSVIVKF